MRHDPTPHPLAGRSGQGPPFAPPNWTWKAGQRLSDMYFCSPEGRRIRSQRQLQEYLASIPNPPPFSQFCWRITPEDIKPGPLPGVEAWNKKRLKGAMEEKKAKDGNTSPKRKQPEQGDDMSLNNAKRMKTEFQKVHVMYRPQVKADMSPPRYAVDHPYNLQSNVLPPRVVPFEVDNPTLGRRRKKSEAHTVGALKYSFQSILLSPSSYKWLSNGNEVCQQFLHEAGRLNEKSAAEKTQLRQLLLKRELEGSNFSLYDTPVLCVFVSILRNEDPPSSLGKAELVSLCANWHCKHKQYWCALETGKLRLLSPPKELAPPMDKLIGHGNNLNGVLEGDHAKEPRIHLPSSNSHGEDVRPVLQQNSDVAGMDNTATVTTMDAGNTMQKDNVEEFTALSYFKNFKNAESSLSTHVNLNGIPEIGKDGEGPDKVHNRSAGEAGGGHDGMFADGARQIKVEKQADYQDGLQDIPGFAKRDLGQREKGVDGVIVGKRGKKGRIPTHFPVPECDPGSTICLCKSCIGDPSFCRGCTCSFCKVAIWPDEKWKMLECAVCGHVCHFLCAFNQQKAGVFKESGLDGEWECPGCAHRSDLLAFWRSRVKSAVSVSQVEEIEKHLLLAVLMLKDSEREAFQPLQCKVMEAHQLVQQDSPKTVLLDLLQVIQKELDNLADEEGTLAGEDAEWAQEAMETGKDYYNWHDEERKISALQKEAKAEYEEWKQAEKAAEAQRALLAEYVQRADAEARAHAQHATMLSLQAYKGRRRMQVMKLVQAKMGVTLEQVELQRADLHHLTTKLQQLQHDVAYFEAPGTNKESLPALSKLLEQLMAQREIVESARFKLDYMVSLYGSR
ncbi:unnamed protein product [Sphagnum troendelagicum]|uniref:MBD domain-containing protein n=1 Tax=Sphagnum troendelagicum TaxID=128251 RepID=A0ABP0UGH8_9BRYO